MLLLSALSGCFLIPADEKADDTRSGFHDVTADVADLEQALELAKGKPPFERARIQFELAKVTGKLALIDDAIAGFETSTLPLIQRELGLAKAWRAARRGGT